MPLAHIILYPQAATQPSTMAAIRVNQLGYLPDAPKVAVLCSVAPIEVRDFIVTDAAGKTMLQRPAILATPFGPCVVNYRLDFSSIRKPGEFRIVAGGITSPVIRIRANAYAGAADTLLYYMREQRSGFNPLLNKGVHTHDATV